MKFTLDILIPTYNRARYLLKNLKHISEIILSLGLEDTIRVIVSDNASTDDTQKLVKAIVESEALNIKYYHQNDNIGMCGNFLYCLQQAEADYIMLLGDDDYFSKEYLIASISAIEKDGVGCVIPAFRAISETGELLPIGRDLGCKSQLFTAGIDNFLTNSTRGHQMSGLILKRDGLYETCVKHHVHNIYIQMFWVSYRCLNLPTMHIPEYPVLVTQTNKKAWSYDNIGLIGEIYNNYKSLPISSINRLKAEASVIFRQPGRILYLKNPIRQFVAVISLVRHRNTSWRGKIILPFLVSYVYCREMALFLKYKIKNNF